VRKPIDRRDVYRMLSRIATTAGIPRHVSPDSLRHAAITNALDAGVPQRDSQILARCADPRTTEHYDRARVARRAMGRPTRRTSPSQGAR
jgi:site-specific recombinase XerD